MKFGELKSIGHNIADSFASGIGLMVGYFKMDVFREAQNSAEGYILVDFKNGTSSGGQTSESLSKAISLYSNALDDLCRKHGTSADAFKELTVRYSSDWRGPCFIVTVQNQAGRRSVDEFAGVQGQRAKIKDELGRVRPKRISSK